MIRVVPAGWSYPDWEGRVYPRPKPRGFHPLAWLARYVDGVEIDSSFYAPARPDWAARWVALVAPYPRFRFTAKLHRSFTHEPLPAGPAGEDELARRAQAFRRSLAPLIEAGRLSAVLVQFPHSFRRTRENENRIGRIARHLGDLPRVLEVRHRGWFEPSSLAELASGGWSVAALDLPAASDHPPAEFPPTGPIGYLRLHGRNREAWFDRRAGRDERYDWLYAPETLDEIAERARRLAGRVDETWVVTNNHFEGKAVANALELRARLEGGPVRVPPDLVRTCPRLAGIARPEGQGELFP